MLVKCGVAVLHALAHKGQLCGRKLPAAAVVFGKGEPTGQPQLHQEKILRRAVALRLFGGGARREALYIIRPEAAHTTHTAVGRRADAPIIAAVPIQQIVPPLVAGLGKVADFILVIARGLQLLHGIQVKIGGGIVVRQTGGQVAVKRCTRFYF